MQAKNNHSVSIAMMGATGAVGGETVKQLITNPRLDRLTLLGRRKLEHINAKFVQQVIIDISDPGSYQDTLANHTTAICTLGVGQPSRVTREEFIQIDKDAVLEFATVCKGAGVQHFQLLASVGIDAQSKSFYLRSKGELLEALKALEFDRLSIFQPSMILTPENRYGISQGLTLLVWPLLNPLMVGWLKQYRGIRVEILGSAIANNSFTNSTSYEALFWQDFNDLSLLGFKQ